MSNYLFSEDKLTEASNFFHTNGFVGFKNLLSAEELTSLEVGLKKAMDAKLIVIGNDELLSNNDVIYADPSIESVCKNRVIVSIAKRLLGRPIELQHSKFNAKPRNNTTQGEVAWHQDYPFFPHTNFDLIACVVHLDDENEGSGPLEYLIGSHKLGVLSHIDPTGNFVYRCSNDDIIANEISKVVTSKRGEITFHHGLTLHRSAPKTNDLNRRLLVFQYRAVDAIQLAGVIWRCTGEQVDMDSCEERPAVARFESGLSVELRGKGGRLYDLFGRLAPNKR